MFDSPFEFCRVCRAYVLLDQTQRECARERHCAGGACPLRRFFTGIDFAHAEPDARGPGMQRGKPPSAQRRPTARRRGA